MQTGQINQKTAAPVFLGNLFANAPDNLLITLWLKGQQVKRTVWLPLSEKGIADLIEAGHQAAADHDVYFSTCPAVENKRTKPRSKQLRISQKDVAGLGALFVDCDTLADPEKKGELLPANQEEAASTLMALSLPPSYMVDSGHGIHAYWTLDSWLDAQEGGRTLKAFSMAVKQATGWAGLDVGASEPARVLRLPGTLNHKGGAPLPVALISDEGHTYSHDQIQGFIDANTMIEAVDTTVGSSNENAENPAPQERWLGEDAAAGGLSDDEILSKAPAAKNGMKFSALWNGDTSAYQNDESEADGALCCMLGFWTRKDTAQTDRLFRRSGLFQLPGRAAKWDRLSTAGGETYGQLTIRTAFEKVKAVYDPGHDFLADRPDLKPYYDAFNKVKGYGMRKGEIIAEKITQDGEIVSVPLTTFTALIKEETSRDDGSEVWKEYEITGRSSSGANLPAIRIKAADYPGMTWPIKFWGAAGNLYPGPSLKDKARFAIIEASKRAIPPMEHKAVFTHTGWRVVDGQLKYLYNGGAVGGPGTDVELDGNLSFYQLPEAVRDPLEAIHASLGLLDVAPPRVAFPVLAHTYLAPLCHFLHQAQRPPAFVMFLAGGTGTRKTTLAVLEMAHFGAEWSATRMPASFADTSNSIRNKAFLAKDMTLLVDDYHPVSNPKQRASMTQTAHDLATAWGDYAERGRLRADMTLAAAKPPRGLGLITGEDAPAVTESGTARFYVVEVGLGDIAVSPALNKAQEAASKGLLAESMRAYIEHLAKTKETDHARILRDAYDKYRAEAHSSLVGAHGRLAGAAAWLWIGLRSMLNCFLSYGAITEEQLENYWELGKKAILENVEAQQEGMKEEKPTRMYLQAIHDLVASGKIRLHRIDHPFAPHYEIAGYYDEDYLYLFAGVAFGSVQQHYRDQGATFPIVWNSLRKRLVEERLVATDARGEPTVVKYIPSKRGADRLLHVKRSALSILGLDPGTALTEQSTSTFVAVEANTLEVL